MDEKKKKQPWGGAGPGRPKGCENKATKDFKQAVVNLLEHASPKIIRWLERVAEDDPKGALEIIGKLGEFAFPKLSRSEVKVDARHTHRSEPVSELDRLLEGVGTAGPAREDEKPLPH